MGKIEKIAQRERRRKRIRARVFGTHVRPRLSVFRSGSHIYGQIIDDEKGATLVSASDKELKVDKKKGNIDNTEETGNTEKNKTLKSVKVKIAYDVGELLASKAIKKKIKKAVFDRGGYKYHGRVASLAEGARKGGLEF